MRFLFVDQILASTPGESITGIKHVTEKDFYLEQLPDGRWEFISSLVGETLGQLAAWNVMHFNGFTARPVAGVVAQAISKHEVLLGDTIVLNARIERMDDAAVQYNAVASVDGRDVFLVEGALGPMLPMEQFIDQSTVKQQYDSIYHPESLDKMLPVSGNVGFEPHSVVGNLRYDSVLEFEANVSMVMDKFIDSNAPFFPDHFPRKPVLPMTVLLHSNQLMASHFLTLCGTKELWKLDRLQRIKMKDFVPPGEHVKTQLKVKHQDTESLTLSMLTEVQGKRVCMVELVYRKREQ